MEGEGDPSLLDRPFSCNSCSKAYLRKNNLEDHVLMEHPDSDQAADVVAYKASKGRSKGSLIIQCEICSKRFRYQSDLKNHFESHFRGSRRGRGPGTTPSAGRPPGNINRPRDSDSGSRGSRVSRPCLYCGRTFPDTQTLHRHEAAEAVEFEREANKFEDGRRGPVTHIDFDEVPRQSFHQVDRTDEEFGDDEESSLEIDLSYPSRVAPLASPSLYPSSTSPYCPRLPLPTYDATVPHPSPFSPLPSSLPYPHQNHTSQYSQDYYSQDTPPTYPSPPPAHEDPTTVHGFLPPPPALPVPEFTQGCHRPTSVIAELPDPMEERTFTVLQSKDETVSSCMVSMSPSREVLDLSMPKLEQLAEENTAKDLDAEALMTNGHTEDMVEALDFSIKTDQAISQVVEVDPEILVKSLLNDILDIVLKKQPEINPEEQTEQKEEMLLSEEIHTANISINGVNLPDSNSNNTYVVKVKRIKDEQDQEHEEDEELVIFEPHSMPSMPEANIALQDEKKTGTARNLFDHDLSASEWREYEDYSGLMEEFEEEEMEEDTVRSASPVQFDDPNRIDCKYCGMIFNDGHVRKFHEQSHMEIEDTSYDDGELTRLFCGFCGKTFKKAKYRMIHERSHTGELPINCPNCNRQFRWESELKSHNKLYCTRESPASNWRNKPGPKPKPKSEKPEKPEKPDKPEKPEKTEKPEKPTKPEKRSRLIDQAGWEDNPAALPPGWKMRTRPRPTQEGQLYFIFLSPDQQIFHSRKSMMQYMESLGTHPASDFDKIRQQLGKPGPRGNGRADRMKPMGLAVAEFRPGVHRPTEVKTGGQGQPQVKTGNLAQAPVKPGDQGATQVKLGAQGQNQIKSGGLGQPQNRLGGQGQSQMRPGGPGQAHDRSNSPGQVQTRNGSQVQGQIKPNKIKPGIVIKTPSRGRGVGGGVGGVKRGPGRPSRAELDRREEELLRLSMEAIDNSNSNSGFRLSYKEDSDSSNDEDEGGSNVKRRKKKLQRKKRKTA